MTISRDDAKRLLERLIFDDSQSQEWVQDVWDLNPVLGDRAAKLWEVFEVIVECCPPDKLENLLQHYYQDSLD
ncbi:MAG TPA: hypothetical protein ACFE0H_00400 [Elainellaceae cyanobacterium]